MHSLIRNVSQGSNRQDFVGEVLIILSTTSSETCLKTVIFEGRVNLIFSAKVSLIFLILFGKRRQTGQPMTFQTHGMEVLDQ